MVTEAIPFSPLIADPSSGYLESLRAETPDDPSMPVLAGTLPEAHRQLTRPSGTFSGLFINPRISEFGAISMIRIAIQRHPGTPLFLIQDGEAVLPSSTLLKLPISGVLKKPLGCRQIQSLIAPILDTFDVQSALKRSRQISAESLVESYSDFTPVLVQNFLSGRRSFFDIYIRIGALRYLKIVRAGDLFSSEQLSRLIRKGVSCFYLRRDAQAAYLKYCDHLTSQLIRMKCAPKEIVLSQTLNLGQETMTFLHHQGITSEYIEHAHSFLANVHEATQRLNLFDTGEFRVFLNDLAAYEHGVATSTIASLFIRVMKIESPRLQKMIGISSLMHDIGLCQMKELLPENINEETLTPEQKEIYRGHPRIGAQIIAGSRKFDQAVIQAVEQHHLRRDGSGFPGQSDPDRISRIAEIIGISDELAHLMVEGRTIPQLDPMGRLLHMAKNRFSVQILEACRKLYKSKTF